MFRLLFLLFYLLFPLGLLATNYYINDATYNASDIYTTAVGNNANNGTTANTPKLTFANLWATYGPAGTNAITNGDIIYVDAGTYVSASSVVGTCNCAFTFSSSITIQGAGDNKTIFDNNHLGISGAYNFATLNASVTISGVQFKNYSPDTGGKVFTISGTGAPGVTLTNVIMNSSGGSAGYAPIYIQSNSTVTITGGGTYCNGTASYPAAGGIDVVGTSITLNITNHSFIGNYKSSAAAVTHGGTLSITGANNTTDVTLSNCLFSGNQTDNDNAHGGAIYATTGDLILTDCIIETSDTYENSVKYGGAAYFTGGTQQFTRVLVRNNTNSGGSTYGTVSVQGGALTLTNCYFSGNTSDRGKDIYCKSGTITATNTSFVSAVNQIATYGGTITITNCGTPTDQYSSGTFTDNGGAAPAFTTPTTPTYTGTCAGSNVVLPVDLLYFNAQKDGGNVELFWATASEHNNDYFVIEKSVNGIDWTQLATIKGQESSYVETRYSVIDDGIYSEIMYYRLSQVDIDGEKKIYPIISIHLPNDKNYIYLDLMGEPVDINRAPSGMYLKCYYDGLIVKIIK